jgi:hypothetical protein
MIMSAIKSAKLTLSANCAIITLDSSSNPTSSELVEWQELHRKSKREFAIVLYLSNISKEITPFHRSSRSDFVSFLSL